MSFRDGKNGSVVLQRTKYNLLRKSCEMFSWIEVGFAFLFPLADDLHSPIVTFAMLYKNPEVAQYMQSW